MDFTKHPGNKAVVVELLNDLEDEEQDELFFVASHSGFTDEYRLAAALLLCTCDSNERKAGE